MDNAPSAVKTPAKKKPSGKPKLVRWRPQRPPLRLTPYAWAKLLFLRDVEPVEIGGFGISSQDNPLVVRDVRLVAQNGPVDVHLDADEWIGKGLEGSTQNGPIKLMVPPGLKSGVLVEGSASSPARWNGVPQQIQTQATGSRSFRFGDGPVMVRLSTVNGPLKIQAPQRGKQGVEI